MPQRMPRRSTVLLGKSRLGTRWTSHCRTLLPACALRLRVAVSTARSAGTSGGVMDRRQGGRLPLIASSGKGSLAWLSSDTTRFRRGNEGRHVLRPIAAALSGLALALVALAPASAAAAASPITAYTFAQSSLAGGGFENVIAADPQNNGVVISGSDVGGLDRSTDFGVTWAADENGTIDQTYHTVAGITFDPGALDVVYAATDAGVAESTDD